MKKDDLLKQIRNEAVESARIIKKTKQLKMALIYMLFLYVAFIIIFTGFVPKSPSSLMILINSFCVFCTLTFVVIILGKIILPFGKISSDDTDKLFAAFLSRKIALYEERVNRNKENLLEDQEKLYILKKL